MQRTTYSMILMTVAALTPAAEASSFRRDDATLGAQTARAEQVVVATVATVRAVGEHDQELTLQVEETLKGERLVTVSFVADRHTTLAPTTRVGSRGLFFLARRARAASSSCRDCPRQAEADEHGHASASAGQLILDRGPRSAIDLGGVGGSYALAVARAHAAAEHDPSGLLAELVQGVARAPGDLASDCAQELLVRVEGGAQLTSAQGQTLLSAFERRRDRLADRAPLVRLLGLTHAIPARGALLRSVADPRGFDPGALSEALQRSGAEAADVLTDNLARNPSQQIRARAARVLGRMPGTTAALARAVRWDPEPTVRSEALLALARGGGAAALREATRVFADAEAELLVRKSAALALVELGQARLLASEVGLELGRFVEQVRRSPSRARQAWARAARPASR